MMVPEADAVGAVREGELFISIDADRFSNTGASITVMEALYDIAVREDTSWFWTDEWQQRHRRALQALEAGRVEEFQSMEDFLESLDL